MALTEEQRRIAQQVAMESPSPQYEEDLVTFAERFLAALPKPEAVAHINQAMRIKWLVSHEVAAKLIGHKIYTEAPIAHPASAPSEQKPVPAWIGWSGGDCPIKPGEEFKVRLENGEELIGGVEPAWNWSHDDPFCEPIIAYCIVSKPEPQTDYKAQRDALLKCLALIEPKLDFSGWENGQGEDIGNEIDAAIASVKGGE